MLTVACVLRSGGIYAASWVAKLRAGVAKHLPLPHRFVCLSDVDVPCERIPLEHDWPGWWSKIELFKLPRPVLYFDLDTAILGDLSDIAAHAQKPAFTMLRDFYAQDHFGSGVMAWDAGADIEPLYCAFAADPMAMVARHADRGDQNFIEDAFGAANITRWQDVLPGQVVSYKVHCTGGVGTVMGHWSAPGVPHDARVVCLHGHPKFADMPPADPVRQAWELAA